MDESVIEALLIGAGGNVAATLLTAGAVNLRSRLVGFMRHGSAREREEALSALDADARELDALARAAGADPGVLAEAENRIAADWTRRLGDYVQAHEQDADALPALLGSAHVVRIGSQTNSGSGTFVNGTVFGGIRNSADREAP
ncbi:hypothetical protein [Kitasatospora cineracea]|uniref:hypothetical protein n=1 Tax=Kitasatospora cineracea TaxID=88074 RepID=UPI0036A902DF